MAESQNRVGKRKHTRAFAPKVRTGCLTCKIRRKKCDEEKPVCRRCRDSMVICDGYASDINNVIRATKTDEEQQPLHQVLTESRRLPCPDICSSSDERRLFRQFRDDAKSAFSSLGPIEFWDHYVMPLTLQSEPVLYASIAVAAAHQLFLCRSTAPATCDQTAQLEFVAIQQYNRAIGYIKAFNKLETTYDMQCVLTCCLLFVCLESMSGRYTESIRHFRAGTQLLANLESKHDARDLEMAGGIADMFAGFGIGISIFMEEVLVPRPPGDCGPLQIDGGSGVPFSSLNEASLALRCIDVYYIQLMFSANNPFYRPPTAERETGIAMLESWLTNWNSRFDATVQVLQYKFLSDADQEQVMRMRLTQRLWQLSMPHDRIRNPMLASRSFSTFLDEAENMAKPFIAAGCPTFAVDGDLVPGLSLVTTLATDARIRSRALGLLRSLDRREGVWDSRELAELHEATLSHDDSEYWYTREVEGGIPGYMRVLAAATPTLNSSNGILRMTSHDN